MAAAAAAPDAAPPLSVLLEAAAEIFADPERSWNVLELEALIQAHRDDEVRALESARVRKRWANMKALTEQTRRSGGLDDDVDDDAFVHFALALSVGLADGGPRRGPQAQPGPLERADGPHRRRRRSGGIPADGRPRGPHALAAAHRHPRPPRWAGPADAVAERAARVRPVGLRARSRGRPAHHRRGPHGAQRGQRAGDPGRGHGGRQQRLRDRGVARRRPRPADPGDGRGHRARHQPRVRAAGGGDAGGGRPLRGQRRGGGRGRRRRHPAAAVDGRPARRAPARLGAVRPRGEVPGLGAAATRGAPSPA